MRRVCILVSVLLGLLLVACSEDATPTSVPATEAPATSPTAEPSTPDATAEESPTPVPATETPPTSDSPLAQMEHTPDPRLVDIIWQWQRRDTSTGATQIIVPNPDTYTITFNEDGTFSATLDCNSAGGQYATPDLGSIFMELGPSTMAACEPDSLADLMANMFGPAQSYSFEEDDQLLVFSWAAGGPVDYYRNAELEVEAPGQNEVGGIPPDAIQLDLQGLAESYAWSVQPGFPLSPGPGGGGMPPHILLTFDGEAPEEVMANNGRRLYIFPTQAYIDMYNAQGNSIVEDQVVRLEQLIAEAGERQEPSESPMPLLPPPNSFMDRWVQFLDLDFEVGRGVRYVSDSPNRQALGTWTNETTGYYYEGLSNNGVFYVSLFWPESTESLPDTTADVPDDVLAAATDPDTYPAYLQETKDRLNALSTSDWNPDLARLDAMAQSLSFPIAPVPELSGVSWQWVSMSDPAGQTTIDDPSRYTIFFNEPEEGAGTADVKADCNNVGATYAIDDSSISISLGPSTLAACPADSLDRQFLSNLESAVIYFFEEDDLFIDLLADSGTMRFADGESVEPPEPELEEGEATGTITAPDGIFIRTGPGLDYPTIGAAPFEATVEIVGRSEGSEWWVISVPVSAEAPEGQGWVAAEFIEATNADDVPVIPAPALEAGLSDTTWYWASLVDPTGQIIVDDPTSYTILFNEDNSANILADCNNVAATYSVDANSISITLGPTTLAECPPNSLDRQFLTALENVTTYFFEINDLFMEMPADGGTMRFTPSPQITQGTSEVPDPDSGAASAQGILFQLVSFGLVGAELAVLPGTQITATFSETEVTGSAGYNDYTGVLTPVEDYFTVGSIAVTEQQCSEPVGIMEQELAYLTALEATDGFLWQTQSVNNSTVITAGQLFYTLPGGVSGTLNFVAGG